MLCLSVIQSHAFFRHLVCPTARCLFFYSAESGFLMWSIYNAHRGEHPLPLAFSCLLSRLSAFLTWLDVFFAVDSYASLCYNVCGIKSQSTPVVWAPLSSGAHFLLLTNPIVMLIISASVEVAPSADLSLGIQDCFFPFSGCRFCLLTSIPRADKIIMCYGYMLHHGTPPVTCPPQVTISGVLFLSSLIPPPSQSAAVFLGPH